MKLILLIDDDEMIRLSFGMALRRRGYKVIEAETGEAGLQIARQQMPDLILSDINMPGLDGQDLLRHIRADPKLCSKQVVLMTGRPDVVPVRRGMEQGADDFLIKPISFEALISCVAARFNRAELHWRVDDVVLSKLRSSLTAQLPHEFITPLAGIIGLSELLQADFTNLTPAEMQEFHRDIHLSAMRLHRTVRNYLLMLELEAGPPVGAEPVGVLSRTKLQDCLNTAVNLTMDRHGRKDDATVACEDCAIRVNLPDFTQMIEELVDNALKFSRKGTPVEIRMGVDGALVVTDMGRGMTEDEIKQIGAFQQFDRKKHEQQGLGLGLVLVQKFAERNGAHLSLARRPEGGVQARLQFQTENPLV